MQSLAELLAVPLDNRYPALDLTPQRKKEKTFEALLRQVAGLAQAAARADDFRGFALGRPELTGTARSDRRTDRAHARAADRDLPSRVSSALGGSATRHDACLCVAWDGTKATG